MLTVDISSTEAVGRIIGSGAVMSVCRGSVQFVCRLQCQGASEAVGLHSCMSVRKSGGIIDRFHALFFCP